MSDRPAERGPSGTGHDTAGCERHKGDPHNLCEECWKVEPPPVAVPSPASLSPAEPPDEHPDATSRPWAVDPAYPCTFGGDLMGSEGEWGVRVGETAEPEDAALIVQAVNERAALLAVGERDRQQIARLTEALERIAAEESFTVDHEYGDFEAIRADDMLASVRAVLAGEEDAPPKVVKDNAPTGGLDSWDF